MEIQAIQHNENLLRYRLATKEVQYSDFTLNNTHSTFRTDLKPSFLVKGTSQLICCSIPPILTIVTVFAQQFLAFYFATSLNDSAILISFGLGTTFLRLFGYNVVYAFNNNLTVLISQAHGARDPFSVGVHFQRGLLFQIPLFAAFCMCAYFSEPIIDLLDMDEESEVISAAVQFIQISSPSILFSGIFDVCRIYLCGQNYFGLPFYVKVGIAGCNYLLNVFFVPRYGLSGIAISQNISEFLGLIILFFCISRLNLTSWIAPTLMSLSKWVEYIRFALPGGFALYMHFLYIDILMFFVSSLKDRSSTTAHVSFINLRPLIFAIPLGTSVSVTSFVGQSIGENAKKKAQTAALMGVITCNLYFIIQVIAWYFLQESVLVQSFFQILSVEEQDQFTLLFNIYIFLVVFIESHQFMLAGIMKGIGMLSYNLKFYILSFYCFGVPVTALLAHLSWLTFTTIWITYFLSNLIVCACQIHFLTKIDWNSLVQNTDNSSHMNDQQNIEDGGEKPASNQKQFDQLIPLDNDIELPLIQSTKQIYNSQFN